MHELEHALATPLAPPPASPPSKTPAQVHGMCLRHADYHPMTGDCWSTVADFFFAHQHLPEAEARAAYLLAVEQQMLNQHIRQYHGGMR